MGIGWMEVAVWKKLRAKTEGQTLFNHNIIKPESCLSVGRAISQNVVIGDTKIKSFRLTTLLIVDQSYSPIFDHRLDHVPGMFIIEVLRQTALLAIYAHQDISINKLLFHGCDINFQQFCELSGESQCVINLQEVKVFNGLFQIPASVIQNNIKNTLGTITFKVIA